MERLAVATVVGDGTGQYFNGPGIAFVTDFAFAVRRTRSLGTIRADPPNGPTFRHGRLCGKLFGIFEVIM